MLRLEQLVHFGCDAVDDRLRCTGGREDALERVEQSVGEAEIDEQSAEDAIKRAEEKLAAVEHSMDAEEVAYLQGIISRSAAAITFKRKYRN